MKKIITPLLVFVSMAIAMPLFAQAQEFIDVSPTGKRPPTERIIREPGSQTNLPRPPNTLYSPPTPPAAPAPIIQPPAVTPFNVATNSILGSGLSTSVLVIGVATVAGAISSASNH